MITDNYRIILVEDDESLLELLTIQLEAAGYAVTPFATGHAACEHLHEGYHLLITDWRLPDGTGDALVARAHQCQPPLATILMSAHPDVRQLATHCGADACFYKGGSDKQLVALVQQCVSTTPVSPTG